MKSKIMTAAGLLTVALTFTGCAGNQAKETAAPAGEATTQAEETTAQADASVKETESEAVSETTGNAAESETKNFEQRLEPVEPAVCNN
ncbi:MAG TPA: hypothetical protein DD387_02260 [Lachnoclostridium sp.]|nr:hypothetical protein [Lachnoclostridium sp.]